MVTFQPSCSRWVPAPGSPTSVQSTAWVPHGQMSRACLNSSTHSGFSRDTGRTWSPPAFPWGALCCAPLPGSPHPTPSSPGQGRSGPSGHGSVTQGNLLLEALWSPGAVAIREVPHQTLGGTSGGPASAGAARHRCGSQLLTPGEGSIAHPLGTGQALGLGICSPMSPPTTPPPRHRPWGWLCTQWPSDLRAHSSHRGLSLQCRCQPAGLGRGLWFSWGVLLYPILQTRKLRPQQSQASATS